MLIVAAVTVAMVLVSRPSVRGVEGRDLRRVDLVHVPPPPPLPSTPAAPTIRRLTAAPRGPVACRIVERHIECQGTVGVRAQSVRVYDFFIYNGENHTLHMHLRTLAHAVDRFIVVEGAETFSGRPKPYHLDQAAAAAANILLVHLPPAPKSIASAWKREGRARDALFLALPHLDSDDDWVIISDTDEIVRPEVVDFLRRADIDGPIVHINVRFTYYSYSCESSAHEWHLRAVKVRYLRSLASDVGALRGVRDPRLVTARIDGSGGWHCSWCFASHAEMARKAASYSHTEHNAPHYFAPAAIEERVRACRDLFDRPGDTYRRVCPTDVPYYLGEFFVPTVHFFADAKR